MNETLADVGIDPERVSSRDPPESDEYRGRDDCVGTFAEGTATVVAGRTVVEGASDSGWRVGTVVDTVIFEGTDISPGSGVAPEVLDVEGLEFRLGDDELHLRRPSE